MNDENLKPFKPGQSGNPAGKPKGIQNLKTIIRKFLDLEADEKTKDGQTLTKFQQMVLKQVQSAETGSLKAFREIMDRLEGKPVQSTKLDATISFDSMSEVEKKKKLDDLLNGI